jgi:hypothetical protein
MLCGASEIDLEDKIDGLLELPADAPVGMNIREYLKLDDNVIDISITPNRGDCFSIRGIAREIAVINQLKVNEPEIQSVPATITDEKAVTISTEGTPRYLVVLSKMSMSKRRHLNGWNRHWHAQAFVRIVFWWILPTMYYSSLVNRCMPLIWQKSKVRFKCAKRSHKKN